MDKGIQDFCLNNYDKSSKIFTYKLERGSIGFYCNTKVSQINKKNDVSSLIDKINKFYIIVRKKDFEILKDITNTENSEYIFNTVKENQDYLFLRAHTN